MLQHGTNVNSEASFEKDNSLDKESGLSAQYLIIPLLPNATNVPKIRPVDYLICALVVVSLVVPHVLPIFITISHTPLSS